MFYLATLFTFVLLMHGSKLNLSEALNNHRKTKQPHYTGPDSAHTNIHVSVFSALVGLASRTMKRANFQLDFSLSPFQLSPEGITSRGREGGEHKLDDGFV